MRFPDDVPTLTRGDVRLRAHRPDDADSAVEQSRDPDSIRWTTVPLGYTREHGLRWVDEVMPAGWRDESEFGFAIEATHPDGRRRYSGTVSLRVESRQRAEIAFGLHPAVRGRRVMTTAVRLALDWGFAERGLQSVIWFAHRGNVSSRRVAWACGFTFGGTVRRWLEQRGEYRDAWVASLHRDDDRSPKTRWLETPVFTGQRVVLRPLTESDVPSIVAGCRDLRTRRFLAFLPDPYTEADAVDYLAMTAEASSLGVGVTWAMAEPADGRHLGNIGIPRMGAHQGEVGYWTSPAARGRGLTSEAVGLVVRHALAPERDGGLGLERVFLHAAASNAASQQVARVNGMTEVGRLRCAERLGDGSRDDLVVFDALRSEKVLEP